MSTSPDESSLGILDLEELCKDFDSVCFAGKLNQTANELAKRQEDMRQSLRSTYAKSPTVLDLLGNAEVNTPKATNEDPLLVSTDKSSPTAFVQGLDSKYFEESLFDPSSLRYSDAFCNSSIAEVTTVELPLANILPTQERQSNTNDNCQNGKEIDGKTEKEKTNIPEQNTNISSILENIRRRSFQQSMQTDELIFLPQEMSARSTLIHDMGLSKQKDPSWNFSGFSVKFEKSDSGFSSSPMSEQFDGDAQGVIDNDEKEFKAKHDLEISENHDYGEVTAFESSVVGPSLTASRVFGHQSWIPGGGPERPSLGMLVNSPVRPTDSTFPSLLVSSLIGGKAVHQGMLDKALLPKIKPAVTRRSTHIVSKLPEPCPTIQESRTPTPVRDFSTPDSSSSTLANSSMKTGTPGGQVYSSSSLPVSPVPFNDVSSHSCKCSSSSSSSHPSDSTIPFHCAVVPPTVKISQQAVLARRQCTEQSADLCPSEFPPIIVCLGERTEYLVPFYNPFAKALKCHIKLTGAFSNQHSVQQSDVTRLVSWEHKGDVFGPNQRRNIRVHFLARTPGQLCLTLELGWYNTSFNDTSAVGKSCHLLNCDVVLPKVTISSNNLKIKYHAFTNTAETVSFTLLNHTLAPVTVGLNMVVPGGEDVMWSDGELFFSLEHLQQNATNNIHQWHNTDSPYMLTARLGAGTANTPSRAEIPVSFKREKSVIPVENNHATIEYGATIIVSQKNFQPARSLAAVRISLVSSHVPLCSTTSSSTNIKEESKLKLDPSIGQLPNIKSKKCVYFHATEINGCRKEEIVLRNGGPACSVSASIEQESSVFQLCSDPSESSNELLLKKRDSITLTVAFRPTDKCIYEATLLISAVTCDNHSASFKIPLHGYGGCCKLSVHACSTTGEPLSREVKSLRFSNGLEEVKQLWIVNKGVRPAFCTVAETSENIRISTPKFVVLPYSQQVLKVTRRAATVNENLLIFYGEEHFRQTLAKKLPSLRKPSLLSRCDITGTFFGQEQVQTETLYGLKDFAALGELFYKNMSHFDIFLSTTGNDTLNRISALESTLFSD